MKNILYLIAQLTKWWLRDWKMGLKTQSTRENFNYELLFRKFRKFKRNSCSTLLPISVYCLYMSFQKFLELEYWASNILKHRILGPKSVLIETLILGTVLMLNRTKMSLNSDVKRFLGTSFKSSVYIYTFPLEYISWFRWSALITIYYI